MKRSVLSVAGIVIFITLVVVLLWRRGDRPAQVTDVTQQPAPAAKPATQATQTATPVAVPPAAPATVPPPVVSIPPLAPDDPIRVEVEAVALNIRHFGQRFGGNPVGTNAEIVKTLNGGNPQGARYLPPESLRLNDQGELLDHWGTPYFFHQNSSTEMEIRSAGPDKRLWTRDDIIAK